LSSTSREEEVELLKNNDNNHKIFSGISHFNNKNNDTSSNSSSCEQNLSKESISIDSQSSDSLFKPRNLPTKKSTATTEDPFMKNSEPNLANSMEFVVPQSVPQAEVINNQKKEERVFAVVDDNIKVRKISSRLRIDDDEDSKGNSGKKFHHTPGFGNKMISPFIFEAGKYREK